MTGSSAIDETVRGFTKALSRALTSEQVASQRGLFQQFDPRVRLIGFLALLISVVMSRRLWVLAALFSLATLIGLASGISLASLAKRVWIVVFAFTGLIALPAIVVTPGDPLFTVPMLHWVVSAQGIRTAAFLLLRAETAVTMATLLVLSTPWPGILKALRTFHLPAEVVTMLAMTHRYLSQLIETTNQMFEAQQSRTVGQLGGPQQRRIMARVAGLLLGKSVELSQEVYLAMISRGFRGEVHLWNEPRMRTLDYLAITAFLFIGGVAIWVGR
jgi:cobalt ECF transporter T component CbiQ